jgi:hypothetical protein
MFATDHDTDPLTLGRRVTATTSQLGVTPTATDPDGAGDAHVVWGGAAQEFPPEFADFAAARARGIGIARPLWGV